MDTIAALKESRQLLTNNLAAKFQEIYGLITQPSAKIYVNGQSEELRLYCQEVKGNIKKNDYRR